MIIPFSNQFHSSFNFRNHHSHIAEMVLGLPFAGILDGGWYPACVFLAGVVAVGICLGFDVAWVLCG